MALNDTQNLFIQKFICSRGDIYKTLESLGLDLVHLLAWRENVEFEELYRDVTNKIILHLRQESFLISVQKINDVVKNGVKEETFTQEHGVDFAGNNYFKAKKTVKNIGVPANYLKLALSESSITKAIQVLANEGVLPMSLAKEIMQKADNISSDIAKSFDRENDNGANLISEQKIISYIKQAVLKQTD